MTIETMTAAAVAVAEIANRPLLLDEYPVQDGDYTINMWAREGDELATMRVTREDEDVDGDVTTEIDGYLNSDDLYEIAMTAGRLLAKLGKRRDLAELIKGLTDELIKGLTDELFESR